MDGKLQVLDRNSKSQSTKEFNLDEEHKVISYYIY